MCTPVRVGWCCGCLLATTVWSCYEAQTGAPFAILCNRVHACALHPSSCLLIRACGCVCVCVCVCCVCLVLFRFLFARSHIRFSLLCPFLSYISSSFFLFLSVPLFSLSLPVSPHSLVLSLFSLSSLSLFLSLFSLSPPPSLPRLETAASYFADHSFHLRERERKREREEREKRERTRE